MMDKQCFQIVKKEVAANLKNSGLDIYLLGYAMQGGEEVLLLRADHESTPQFYLYCPGNIIPLALNAFRTYGKIIGKIHCYLMEIQDNLSDMVLTMEDDFANAVLFSSDLRLIPVNHHDDNLAAHSVLDYRAYPPRVSADNKIVSYKDIYQGDMYEFVRFSGGAHATISDVGDFGNGDIALIHAEDGEGGYRDILFPSKRIIGEHGNRDIIDQLLHFFLNSDTTLKH